MDMLANYADEGSNTPKTDTQEKVSEPNADYSELEAEWESFEKMMGDEVLISQEKQIDSLTKRLEMSESIPHTVPLPGESIKSRNSSESKSAKSKSVSSNDYYVGSSSDSSSSDADDETRSHSDDDGRGSEEESSSGRQRRSSKSSSSSESSVSSDKSKTSDDVIEIRSPVKQASPQKDQSAKDISTDRKVLQRKSAEQSAACRWQLLGLPLT